jgi:hypothetical protein
MIGRKDTTGDQEEYWCSTWLLPHKQAEKPSTEKRFVPKIEMTSGMIPRSIMFIWARARQIRDRVHIPKPGYPPAFSSIKP